MESNTKKKQSTGKLILLPILVLILAGGIYYAYTQNAAFRGAFLNVKESAQDAATTSRVRAALVLSKRVSPFDIKAETVQGEVTLTGQVPSDEVRTVAGAIVQDTSGVKQVHNNLGVNPLVERNPETAQLGERVADLEIKADIDDALSKSPELKDEHIDVQVKNRIVTLSGASETTALKYAPEQISWQTSGVTRVLNNIVVTNTLVVPETADDKLARRIEFELYSTKAVSLKTMQIHVDSGTATLSGNVASLAERLLAERVAQSVEGIRKVVNNLVALDETQS
jgi:hyperosmotically inducible protein